MAAVAGPEAKGDELALDQHKSPASVTTEEAAKNGSAGAPKNGAAKVPPGPMGVIEIDGEVDAGAAGKWKVRATGGLWAGIVGSALSLVGVLMFGSPMEKPGHFVFAMIAVYVAGALTNAVVGHARITDALREKENYRRELNRVTADRARLEQGFLTNRLSSSQPTVATTASAPSAPEAADSKKKQVKKTQRKR